MDSRLRGNDIFISVIPMQTGIYIKSMDLRGQNTDTQCADFASSEELAKSKNTYAQGYDFVSHHPWTYDVKQCGILYMWTS